VLKGAPNVGISGSSRTPGFSIVPWRLSATGGTGIVSKAPRAGVPVVTMLFGRDQPEIARRGGSVRRRGTAARRGRSTERGRYCTDLAMRIGHSCCNRSGLALGAALGHQQFLRPRSEIRPSINAPAFRNGSQRANRDAIRSDPTPHRSPHATDQRLRYEPRSVLFTNSEECRGHRPDQRKHADNHHLRLQY
jgi:hypothetical protein